MRDIHAEGLNYPFHYATLQSALRHDINPIRSIMTSIMHEDECKGYNSTDPVYSKWYGRKMETVYNIVPIRACVRRVCTCPYIIYWLENDIDESMERKNQI